MSTIRINHSSVRIPSFCTVRQYGKDRCSLRLSEMAEHAYDATDPLTIYEIENDEDGEVGYLIDGAYTQGLEMVDAYMVNAILEEAYEEMTEADEDDD